MFAVARIGAVHVPINTRFRVSDLQYVLAQSDAATLITHDRSGPVDYLAMARELVEGAAIPGMRRLVIKSAVRHPGTYAWGDVLDGARHVDQATLEARAAAVSPATPCSSCTRQGRPAFRRG